MTYRNSTLDLWTVIIFLAVFLAGVGGWVANIVAIANGDFTPLTGMMVLRVIGIFFAPLGAVLGYF